jgi:hypothetical protein
MILGGNLSSFGGPDGESWSSRTGLLAGAFLSMPLSETPLAWLLEAMLTQKGGNLKAAGGESGGYRVSYLQFNALGQYDFALQAGSRLVAGLQLGTTLAFRTGCLLECQ